MRKLTMVTAIIAAALFVQSASAFELIDRLTGLGCCDAACDTACEPAACEPACAPACEPACVPACAPVIKPKCQCELVCGTKKVKKHRWVVKTERFCPLLPGSICCDGCGSECGVSDDGCADDCGPTVKTPRCGICRCRKILVKEEYEVEVPSFKCEPQDVCNTCDPVGCGACDAVVAPQVQEDTGPAPVPTTYLGNPIAR